MSIFYGSEIEIWAGFGPVGNTEKKIWAKYEQLLRVCFFMSSLELLIKLNIFGPVDSLFRFDEI